MTNTIKTPLLIAGSALLLALPATAAGAGATQSQAQSVNGAAREDCKLERRFDRFEFRQDYRGMGKAAMRRCIGETKREARWDCREERVEDAAEYRARYGTGRAGFKRCLVDEIR